MNSPTRPAAPSFPLRQLDRVAYAMSVVVGALGQVLFLGERFGGHEISYIAATMIAAYAEVTMAAAGDWSLEHRAQRRVWMPLLVLGVAVSAYAALLNVTHFWASSPSMALMFGGASVVGFLMHVINGHIKVRAYLIADDEYRATAAAREAAEEAYRQAEDRRREREARAAEREAERGTETGTHRPKPKKNRPRPAGTESATATGTAAGTGAGAAAGTGHAADPSTGTDRHSVPVGAGAGTGLRLVADQLATSPAASTGQAAWDPDLWARAVATATEYRARHGADVTLNEVQALGIGRGRAVQLRRAVLESGQVVPTLAVPPVPVGGSVDGTARFEQVNQ